MTRWLFALFLLHVDISSAAEMNDSIVIPSGLGTEYYKSVLNRSLGSPSANLIEAPLQRAGIMFANAQVGCFFGANAAALKTFFNVDGIEGENLLEYGIGVYTHEQTPTIKSVQELKGKRAAQRIGNNFTKNAKEQFQLADLIFVSNDDQLVKMLQMKRVDTIFYWYPDKKHPDIHRDLSFSVFQSNATLVCQKQNKYQKLIDRYNEGLLKLRKNGWLKQEFEKIFGHRDVIIY